MSKMFTPCTACLLLVFALCLHGVKYADTFLIWGIAALTFCARGLVDVTFTRIRFLERYSLEILLFLWVLYAQSASRDPAVSLFPTTQALIFILIWITLTASRSHRHEPGPVVVTVLVLGAMTICRTLLQYCGALRDFRHFIDYDWAKTYGFLPVNPTFNAIFMCSAALLLVAPGIAASKPKKNARLDWLPMLSRVVGVGLILMVCIGPSRSSLIALSVGLLYLIWPHITFRGALAALLGAALFLGFTPHRFWEGRLRLNEGNYRTRIWKIAVSAAQEHPLAGYGLGNFELAYQKYSFPVETDTIRYARTTSFAHNEYLQVLSDLGIPGFFLFLILIVRVLISPVLPLLRPMKAALIALCAAATSAPIWHLPFLAYWTLLLSAIVFAHAKDKANPAARSAFFPQAWRWTLMGAVASLTLSLSWCAWRYSKAENNQWADIVRWNPRDATAWQQLAYHTSDVNSSLPAFARAATLVPDNPYFHESLARALESCRFPGNAALAMDQYELALQRAPHRAINHLAIGRLLYLQGKPQTALPWFRAARRMEPHYWECDLWIARSWKRLGDDPSAAWALHNLMRRRDIYLSERKRMINDLPAENDFSEYGQHILAYDVSVIHEELSGLQAAHAHGHADIK